MATVYPARDPRFKPEAAIKVLPSQFLDDPNFRARFDREAQMIAAIEDPAIVPVYDYGEEDGQPCPVMRYMPGGCLSDKLQAGPLSFAKPARILAQLAPALDEMHSRGIVHRDLKPGNILFEVLTGKQPYQATTPMVVAIKHITEPAPHILSFRADLPPGSDELIASAMAK